MRISDWSSDVCSSYLLDGAHRCRSRLKFSRSKEVCHQRHVSHRGAPVLSGSDPESYDPLVTFGLPQGHQIIGKRHVVGNVRRNSPLEIDILDASVEGIHSISPFCYFALADLAALIPNAARRHSSLEPATSI